MPEHNTHINYSVDDIERYLNGKMSSKEMHDLESAALQDPFLADAIEGFSNASFEEGHKHLNEITAALQRGKEDAKVVPLLPKSFYGLRVAAIIIFIMGISVISWYIIGSNNAANKNEIAQAKENKVKASDTLAKELKDETTKNDSVETLLSQNSVPHTLLKEKKKNDSVQAEENANSYALNQNQPSARHITDTIIADSFVAENKDASANISSLSAPLPYDTPALQKTSKLIENKQRAFLNNNALNNFNGRITTNNNEPVSFATVQADNIAVVTDTNGYFKLQAPDSVLSVTVSSAGFVSANKQLKSNIANHISIQFDKTALSNAPVSEQELESGTKRNSATNSAYPVGGWKMFGEYVYKKLGKRLDTSNNAETVNSVQIEFSIDENGVPYNFIVLKSLNAETASRAIGVIREGPVWVATSKNKKGRVTIKF